ncbi:MAG: GDP-mannose 4,6-dehydratase [Candidatus Hodarchaeota archaeon]
MNVDFWRNRNVFVTGATGLLGSWLVRKLIEKGANTTCLVRDWVPRSYLILSGSLDKVNVVRGELEDYHIVLRAINEYEIETVFHLGAQTIVGTASRSVLSTFEANIKGTWNVLETCRQCSKLVKQVIIASSDKAYGEHETLPYSEDTPLRGRFPYDVSKACSDLLAMSYFYSFGLPVGITRCGNLYGGGDLNFNRIIPGTIKSVLLEKRPIVRSDGKYIRDYFYVEDAVEAYLHFAKEMDNQKLYGEGFNFGTETPVTVIDLVSLILKLMGREDLEPLILNEASNEIRRQYLDCTKAMKKLNWKAKYPLDEGLEKTITWYKEYMKDY